MAKAKTSVDQTRLQVIEAHCGYADHEVLRGLSFEVCPGEVCCVLGPNGIGKTTLFKSVLGHLPLSSGRILLDGEDITRIPRAKVARKVGYVPQAHTPPFPFTVLDVVEMGRTAHISLMSAPSREDEKIALEALNTLGIVHLHDRIYTEISGGERQMVLIARALAQGTDLLIMDEPTASLDFGNQVKVLAHIQELAHAGLSIVMTTHFPDHAFLCSTKVVVVRGSDDFVIGQAEDVVTKELLEELYDVRAQVMKVPTDDGEMTIALPLISTSNRRQAQSIERLLADRLRD